MKTKRTKGGTIEVSPTERRLVLKRRPVASLSEKQLSDVAGGHDPPTCEPTCPKTCPDTCPRTCDQTCGRFCGHSNEIPCSYSCYEVECPGVP